MKFIEKYSHFNESLSERVYHFTSLRSLNDILKNDKINLSPTLGTDADNIHKEFFFLSMSRTKSGSIGYGKTFNVRIEFDGKSLNNNYKGISVDYFNAKDYQGYIKRGGWEDGYSSKFEYEDRLISDKGSIDNISKFIKRIDIFIESGDKEIKDIKKTIIYCEKLNINLFITSSKKNFNHQMGENELDYYRNIDIDDEIDYESNNNSSKILYFDFIMIETLNRFGRLPKYSDTFGDDNEKMIKEIDGENLDLLNDKEIKYLREQIGYLMYGGAHIYDRIETIKNNIHNNKRYDSEYRVFVENIGKILRKYKCSNIKEYFNLMCYGIRPKHHIKKSNYFLYNSREEEYVDSDYLLSDMYDFYARSTMFGFEPDGADKFRDYFYSRGDLKVGELLDHLDKMYVNWRVSEIVDIMGDGNYRLEDKK